jgi:hypothetical protein
VNTEGATTEERQLAEMLRRVTPEPPRGLTVEDVAVRVASQPGSGRHGGREPHARQGWPNRGWTRKWAPALAAGSVFVVISVSAGAVVGLNSSSHHSPAPAPGGQGTASGPASSLASSPSPAQTSAGPGYAPKQVANGIWGAELISQRKPPFTQDSLAGGADSLYALAPGYLDRINPGTGQVVVQAPYQASGTEPPVVAGNTVWAVSSYAGADVVLEGFNGQTLASLGSVTVPVTGQLAGTPEGVIASGPGGNLYVAAGSGVAVVDPATRQVTKRIAVSAGPVNSVAVSPDGSKLYVSTGSFELLTYDLAAGAQSGSAAIADIGSFGGNLVATAGGVWGTVGVGMTEWAWFAPDANLTQLIRVSQAVGAGADSVPTFSGGTVWLGGSHTLECANPDTGQILASVAIPTDGGVLEHFGRVTVTGDHAYAYYEDQRAQLSGVAALTTPPAACSG